jgi:hypothetical protein
MDGRTNMQNEGFYTNEINLPASYYGKRAFIAFHHNANDMYELQLDDISIEEGALNVKKNKFTELTISHFSPNPFTVTTSCDIESQKVQPVTIQLTDLSGRIQFTKQVLVQAAEKKQIVIERENLASGLYFCSIIAGQFQKVVKLSVID